MPKFMQDNVVFEVNDAGELLSRASGLSEDGSPLWTDKSEGDFLKWLNTFPLTPRLADGLWVNPQSVVSAFHEIYEWNGSWRTDFALPRNIQSGAKAWDLSDAKSWQLIVEKTSSQMYSEITQYRRRHIECYVQMVAFTYAVDKEAVASGDFSLRLVGGSCKNVPENPGRPYPLIPQPDDSRVVFSHAHEC